MPLAAGYRGIWYMNQPSDDEYKYKYSGGMATYPQQHIPIAVYSAAAKKTFFVFGGLVEGSESLHHLVGYYDHATGTVCQPRILLDKKTTDAHDNPTLAIDGEGYLWIFSSAHGTSRPSYIHKSRQPYSIDAFELIEKTNFSYTQPWHLPDHGFVFLHTRYGRPKPDAPQGRGLFWMTSGDGRDWSEPQPLAFIEKGNYQISWPRGKAIATAFDFHPEPVGLNGRTNLYYAETRDGGQSWQSASGQPLSMPLVEKNNPALVRDYQQEKKLVYMKDLAFDAEGKPVILYLTSDGYASGPTGGERRWHTAHWKGSEWVFHAVTTSDHNYDHGSLTIDEDGVWRLIAPTDPGPQPFGTGGEMVLWTSADEGHSWQRVKALTPESKRNHTYSRKPLHAQADFYALWADGDAFGPSPSSLYFTDRAGSHVWRLPETMTEHHQRPEVAW